MSTVAETEEAKTAYRLKFEKDVPIAVSDGLVLRANVYRPDAEEKFPAVLALGPYGKDAHFRDAYAQQWEHLNRLYPDIARNGSTGRFLRWEFPDPERWVPHGYALVHIDARGSGKSPGYLDPRSARETLDFYESIEWAARQPWSNGNVGLLGISYYAINQWQVAAMQPPHLKAIIPWEGACDAYRDMRYHGGIQSNVFPALWWPRQVLVNQHGNGASAYRDPDTGERTTGPAHSEAMLAGSRVAIEEVQRHTLEDEWFKQQTPDFSRIRVPLLSAGNWGGMGLHLRGNVEGFLRAGSKEKWLELHGGTHFESFYVPEGVALQRRFFDHYLKGIDNGWDKQRRVQLAVRRVDGFTTRMENEWPLARTQWTRYYLDAADCSLAPARAAAEARITYSAFGDGVAFTTAPFEKQTEFTGPVAARLWIASSTTDMDIFATLCLYDPNGKEITFSGASEPAVPIAQGWLRASHRKLDPERSTPYRPYHTHDEIQKLAPGEVCAVDVEIWPTSIVCPPGYRLALILEGHDFQRSQAQGPFRGSGPFLHTDPNDRNPAEFGGENTIVTGGERASYLLLPLIPS